MNAYFPYFIFNHKLYKTSLDWIIKLIKINHFLLLLFKKTKRPSICEFYPTFTLEREYFINFWKYASHISYCRRKVFYEDKRKGIKDLFAYKYYPRSLVLAQQFQCVFCRILNKNYLDIFQDNIDNIQFHKSIYY